MPRWSWRLNAWGTGCANPACLFERSGGRVYRSPPGEPKKEQPEGAAPNLSVVASKSALAPLHQASALIRGSHFVAMQVSAPAFSEADIRAWQARSRFRSGTAARSVCSEELQRA